jgi:6-phosphogluconolactonase (cycloisomerase 2 family)
MSERVLLATGSYQRSQSLATWWWDGELAVDAAGSADVDSPSFVCWHPALPLAYAVSEVDEGYVTVVSVGDDGALTTAGTVPTGGAEPCWVTVDPAGAALLVANYASGSMAVIRLDGDGMPTGGPVVVDHSGSGPVAGRQDGPHVHQVVPTADGNVLASDLGTDELVEYRIDPGEVVEVGRIEMPAGMGPRHMAIAADAVTGFVTGELDATVTTIRRSAVDGQAPCSQDGSVPTGAVHPSQIALADGDRWLVVANRGPNTLAVLDVSHGLSIVSETPVGDGPRYFTMDGDRILVACRLAGAVELHRLDGASGQVTRVGALSAPIEAVSCVALR